MIKRKPIEVYSVNSACAALALLAGIAPTAAQQSTNAVALPEMVVTGEANYERRIQAPFLADAVGTKIYSGKKGMLATISVIEACIAFLPFFTSTF